MARIALVVDKTDWALYKNAQDLIKYWPRKDRLEICLIHDLKYREVYNYDLVIGMYYGIAKALLNRGFIRIGAGIRSFAMYLKEAGLKFDTPQSLLRRKDVPPIFLETMKRTLGIHVVSHELKEFFGPLIDVQYTRYTVDTDDYFPNKFRGKNDTFRVGWTGSLHNMPGIRRIEALLKPALSGVNGIELVIQARENKWIKSNEGMRNFYHSLDAYACSSSCEGFGRPVVEAMACGLPIISTPVGVVPEIIKSGKNGFIVNTADEIRQAAIWMRDNQLKACEMGNFNAKFISQEWCWPKLIGDWVAYVDFLMNKAQALGVQYRQFKEVLFHIPEYFKAKLKSNLIGLKK